MSLFAIFIWCLFYIMKYVLWSYDTYCMIFTWYLLKPYFVRHVRIYLLCFNWIHYACDYDIEYHLLGTALSTFLCLHVYYASFFNQPEMPHNIIQNYSSPQLCSLRIEIITWNLLNDYSKPLRVIASLTRTILRRQLSYLIRSDWTIMAMIKAKYRWFQEKGKIGCHQFQEILWIFLRLLCNFCDVYTTGKCIELITIFYTLIVKFISN